MFERMAGESGMVDFDIYFKIFIEAVCFKKTDYRFCICVVLVFHRFHRFGFDQECSLKTLATGIIPRFGQEEGEVGLFTLLIGIQ